MMRQCMRRIPIPIPILPISIFFMAATPPFTNPNPMAGPTSSTSTTRLANLITQLRLYRPPPPDDDVDERGKVFSQMGLAESAAPKNIEFSRPRKAAVLVCLFQADDDDAADGDLRVILTKRSSNLSSHSGEVSLPGGKAEEGDEDDAATATREAKEEIGLDPSVVTVVNLLEPFLSKHLLRVVPVIGVLTDRQAFKPAANPAEVEAIFDAPLDMFLKDENRRVEEREWMGEKYLVHYFDYETETKKFVIWGLTASILIRAASVVYQKPPSFLEQDPKFRLLSVNRNSSEN